MGAAAILERKFKDPAYRAAYKEQEKYWGPNSILATRLCLRLACSQPGQGATARLPNKFDP